MKKNRIILFSLGVLLIAIIVFYYRISIGFGKASLETVKTLVEIKSDLKEKGIDNPTDTILEQINGVDSINVAPPPGDSDHSPVNGTVI